MERRTFGELELELVAEPALREPHVLAILKPWVDVNSVGSLVLTELERHFDAQELGRLARPGTFFDFTRYRPVIHFTEGRREVGLPNVVIRYAQRDEPPDLIFLHLLEPHAHGEAFVEGFFEFFQELGVRRYFLLGSMFDAVPHTRPLPLTGDGYPEQLWEGLAAQGVRRSDYHGPTSIVFLLNHYAPEYGLESLWCIVSLPQYVQIEEDYMGTLRLLELLRGLYGFPIRDEVFARAEAQRQRLERVVAMKPELRAAIAQLEEYYEKRLRKPQERPRLSPDFERFLREITKDLGQGDEG